MTRAAIGLGSLSVDGHDLYWLEARPSESGRTVLCRRPADAQIEELTPAPFNVGSRVHEYGGGAYAVAAGVVVFQRARQWQRLGDRGGPPAAPDRNAGGLPLRRFRMRSAAPPRARRSARIIATTHRPALRPRLSPCSSTPAALRRSWSRCPDFLSSPRLSPDGERFAGSPGIIPACLGTAPSFSSPA